MVVVEEKTNFPSALGRKNIPRTMVRTGPIAERAMALVGGVTPVHLAQRISRGLRGKVDTGLSVHSEYETYVHNLNAQLTKHSILPVLDRPKPVLDAIKAWAPIVPRVKLIGAFGIVDPTTEPGISIDKYVKNIPRPYPRPMEWAPGKLIENIPSVITTGAGVAGPSRTVHPKISIEL